MQRRVVSTSVAERARRRPSVVYHRITSLWIFQVRQMVEGNPKRELNRLEVAMGRPSTGSEVVMMDDRVLETAARASLPTIQNLNVSKSTKVHIGPKIVRVTQNVDNTEMVKGKILGLELVSPMNSRRLRCSIAVFVCWALVVACALVFCIFYFSLATKDIRLDIALPFPRYLWNIAKSTTRTERLLCAGAMCLLILCILLIIYFNIPKEKSDADIAPHEWFITREMWLTPSPFNTTERLDEFEPLRLVIISHTVSPECLVFANCAAEMRNLQDYFTRKLGWDIPYNFLIGNDGRVYEARGWNVVGGHTERYNYCSINIAFIGDYRIGRPSYSKVSEKQLKRAQMILNEGVTLGHLHPQFQVVGARDLIATISPGENLYQAIQKWENYAHNNVFRDRTCGQIHAMFNDNDTNTTEYTTTIATDVE